MAIRTLIAAGSVAGICLVGAAHAQDNPFLPIDPPEEEEAPQPEEEAPQPEEEEPQPEEEEPNPVEEPDPFDEPDPTAGDEPDPTVGDEPDPTVGDEPDPLEELTFEEVEAFEDVAQLRFPVPGLGATGVFGPVDSPHTLSPCRDLQDWDASFWIAAPGDPWGFLELSPDGPRVWAHQDCLRVDESPFIGPPQVGRSAFELPETTSATGVDGNSYEYSADGADITITVGLDSIEVVAGPRSSQAEFTWDEITIGEDYSHSEQIVTWSMDSESVLWIAVENVAALEYPDGGSDEWTERSLYRWFIPNSELQRVGARFRSESHSNFADDLDVDAPSPSGTACEPAENWEGFAVTSSTTIDRLVFEWTNGDQSLVTVREDGLLEQTEIDINGDPCVRETSTRSTSSSWTAFDGSSRVDLISESSSSETESWEQ